MVQYIFTPWRDRSELLMVRRQFYPARYHQQRQDQSRDQDRGNSQGQWNRRQEFIQDTDEKAASSAAVARVSMWMQRGNCPHLVESTALLTAAILDDERSSSSSSYAVRAAYSAAFSRFVTGLLDSHQDKARKMSMYGVAKSVGLPATFVELRHQATHEQLPSLIRLRAAARKALDWIWDYYWRHLAAVEQEPVAQFKTTIAKPTVVPSRKKETAASGSDGGCREVLVRYLDEGDVKKTDLRAEIKKYSEAEVLTTLNSIADTTEDSRILRRAVALTTELLLDQKDEVVDEESKEDRMDEDGDGEEDSGEGQVSKRLQEVIAGKGVEEDEGQRQPSWSLCEEDEWIPKPIGVV